MSVGGTLTINEEQMAAFEEYSARSFEKRMIAHLAEELPEEYEALSHGGTDTEAVPALIRGAVERGREYGIVSEEAVAGYIDLSVVYGQGFEDQEEYAWAKEILADPEFDDTTRIQFVLDEMPEDLEQ